MSRVLLHGNTQVTQTYKEHVEKVKAGNAWAQGVDIVKEKNSLEWIVAHTDGTVVKVVNYLDGTNGVLDRENMGYGNYVVIEHQNNMATLYAHMEKVQVKEGQKITRGTVLGFMGNTGNSFGAHLHFEVREYNRTISKAILHATTAFNWLNAQAYVDIDLPKQQKTNPTPKEDYSKNTIPNRFKVVNKDGKQIAAYTNYNLAVAFASNCGAYVLDSKTGQQIYPEPQLKKELNSKSYPDYVKGSNDYYRVRKTFADGSSSVGAWWEWCGAYNAWISKKNEGYHVFDKDGIQLD